MRRCREPKPTADVVRCINLEAGVLHALEQRRQCFQRSEQPYAAARVAQGGVGGAHVHAKVEAARSTDCFQASDRAGADEIAQRCLTQEGKRAWISRW